MIYRYNFKFGTTQLALKTLSEIKESVKENIDVLINNFLVQLNHNIRNSAAEKFNSGQINIPIHVTREFIDFFEANFDFHRKFSDAFNPFNLDYTEANSLEDLIVLHKRKSEIIKLKDFKFDTRHFRHAYIVDLLKQYLIEEKISDFLIQTGGINSCSGKFIWEIDFSESKTAELFRFQLFNQSGIVVERDRNKKSALEFTEDKINWQAVIMIGESAFYLKGLEIFVSEIETAQDFQSFCDYWGVEIVCIDENLDVVGNFEIN
jgi:hypothetical protein